MKSKSPRQRTPTITQAMDGMFEPWFRGESWNNWRAILKATAALPMTDSEVEFFKTVSGGREPPRKRPREAWYVAGRRAGKDSIVSLVAAYAASTFDPRGILRPGERAVVACVAPDRETAKIIKGYITAFFEMIPSLRDMIQRETKDLVELKNMVDIAILTDDFRGVRGRPILSCVLDEVSMLDAGESETDMELYAALLPGMSTIPSAQMFGISSPYAKKGLLYKKYADNFGKDNDDVLVIQAPSHVMNPVLNTRDRDRMMIEDPARGRAEWYAEFRDDLVAFIDPATVDLCVVNGRVELSPVPGIAYTAAVDPSGGSSDSMTLAIAHGVDGDRGILDLVKEWPAPFSPEQVVIDICDILRRYGIVSVTGDRYGGEWPRERFRNQRIEYQIAEHTRSEAYLTMLPALNSGKIELLNNRRLISQLCQLERRTARSGKDSVDHPATKGAHDDLINAAALALVGAALTPKSNAENFIEFMRRQLDRGTTDYDDIRASNGSSPEFGFSFDAKREPEKLVTIEVPPIAASSGNGAVPIRGTNYMCRYREGCAFIEVERDHAVYLLKASQPWRLLNAGIAAELISGKEEV